MGLPNFTGSGEVPVAIHQATLQRILELAKTTGELRRVILFGSYVTAKMEPNDVDIILVMADDFVPEHHNSETQSIFDHQHAGSRWGASIFWLCSRSILLSTMDEFLAHWQITREQTRRGIVEIVE